MLPDIGGSVCGRTIAVGERPRWLPRQTAHMRALFASTRGAGHFNPLVPFARAFERAGHELLFAGPADLARAVDAAGFEFWQFDAPPEDELGAVWSRVPELPPDEANEVVVGEVFGRLNTTAALPRLREACEEWWPDVVVRDPNEYGSALAAELHGIPHARVAIGLASTEELGLGIAASAIDAIRREQGLPSDLAAAVLRDSPYLSLFPPTLDEGVQPDTHRFRDPAWEEPPGELPDWWPGRPDEPLVYVTFGSVAGSLPRRCPCTTWRCGPWPSCRCECSSRSAATSTWARCRPLLRTCGSSAGCPSRTCWGTRPLPWSTEAPAPLSVRSPRACRLSCCRSSPTSLRTPAGWPRSAPASPSSRGGTSWTRRSARCAKPSTASSASRRTARARGRWRTSCAHSAGSTTCCPCSNAPRAAKLNCLATDPFQNEPVPASGQVWLLADNPREPEIVFDFPFHEDLNEAVKELPRRWFDWRRKHWRVPAHPRVAKAVEALLAQFPDLVPSPEVLAWLSDSDRWRAICTVVARDGRGHFLVRTLQGDAPPELEVATDAGEGRVLLPFAAKNAELVQQLEGLRLDDLALMCARELREGSAPAP